MELAGGRGVQSADFTLHFRNWLAGGPDFTTHFRNWLAGSESLISIGRCSTVPRGRRGRCEPCTADR